MMWPDVTPIWLVVPVQGIVEVDRLVFYCGLLFLPEISGSGGWLHWGG